MKIILVNPVSSVTLWPLSQTRPVADIRIGILTIAEKWEKLSGLAVSHLCTPLLASLYPIDLSAENLFVLGSVLPDEQFVKTVMELKTGEAIENQKGTWLAAKMDEAQSLDWVERYLLGKEFPIHLNFTNAYPNLLNILSYPWQIFQLNGEEHEKDYNLITKGRKSHSLHETNQVIGDRIFLEEGAKVHFSILNSSTGSIYIGKNAEIMEGCMVRGSLALCEGSVLKMGVKIYGPTTIGPGSKVGGEIQNSVIQANSNKAHDGYLGNSVLGEWCNLGADSNTSNLKNTYQEVKLWNYVKDSFIKTNSIFCGMIMGDHAKCGINTMFNTGTVVGVGANVFGAGYPRQFIPDFAWGGATGFSTFGMDKFLETAKAVMLRRNQTLDENYQLLLEQVFFSTAKYRTWEK
jgi:UDP-N-acetylglucosamine diphosphorylase/glucosamine-1-phosphate N-acetyltransferase